MNIEGVERALRLYKDFDYRGGACTGGLQKANSAMPAACRLRVWKSVSARGYNFSLGLYVEAEGYY